MDSGAAITSTDDAEETRSMTPFDPLVPLLPEEVCWILDQALACEVSGFSCQFFYLSFVESNVF